MIQLTVNRKPQRFDGDPDMPLLWYLRDELELTGTKFGCGMGLCGACTVHVDGEAVAQLSTPMSALPARRVTTIEGLDPKGQPSAAARLEGEQRAAVRLLPERPDHAGRRAAQGEAEADRRGHRPRHAGQHLPLRNLPAHPRGHQDRPREVKSMITAIERRHAVTFWASVFSAGAFVVGCAAAAAEAALRSGQHAAPQHVASRASISASSPTARCMIVAHRSEMGTGIRTCCR